MPIPLTHHAHQHIAHPHPAPRTRSPRKNQTPPPPPTRKRRRTPKRTAPPHYLVYTAKHASPRPAAAHQPCPPPAYAAENIPRWAAAYLHRLAHRGYTVTPHADGLPIATRLLRVEIYITHDDEETPRYSWRCTLPWGTARLLGRCLRKCLQRKLPHTEWHLLLINPTTEQILARRTALPAVQGARPSAAPADWLRIAAYQYMPDPRIRSLLLYRPPAHAYAEVPRRNLYCKEVYR